jgi:membrane-associated phospholipid phosphatase
MLRVSAHIISFVMHPLFIVGYVLIFLMLANPYIFGFSGPKSQGLVIISILTISVMFPLIAIVMMKALGLISSLEMPDKKERIGPLIITGLFYMWLYVNVRNNDNIPSALSFFILGSTIAVFMALTINSFTKISLHSIAAGGFLTGMFFIVLNWSYGYVDIPLPFLSMEWRWSDRMVMIIVFLLSGAIGTARLYLKAHKPDEIYGGYIVGILAQMIAYRMFF